MAINRSDTTLLYLLGNNRQRVYRQIVQDSEAGVSGLATQKTTDDLKRETRDLAELINEVGETTGESIGELEHNMQITYLAKADLDPSLAPEFGLEYDADDGLYYDTLTGTSYISILAKIQADASAITESYNYVNETTLQANIDDLNSAISTTTDLINGQIRRGFIEVNGVTYFGIVISSREVFKVDGETRHPEGDTHDFFEIDTEECFGLYTATGWQFWKGNQKLGWFDTQSTDSGEALHVEDISVNNHIVMGDWIMTQNGSSWGLKYLGA